MKDNNLKYIFDQINEWIRVADQKAMILGSFNVAGFVYQLVNLDSLSFDNQYVVFFVLVSVISTICALYFWLRIIYPRLDNRYHNSRIYFLHIANSFKNNLPSGVSELTKMDPVKFEEDLASQIIINSGVAKEKYEDIQKFIYFFAAQLISLFLLFIF